MIEPRPCGTFLEVDEQGHLIRRASADLIQEEWRPVVDAVTDLYRKSFGSNLHSVWLRGSVAKGEALAGCSDLDTFSFVHRKVPWPDAMNQDKEKLQRAFSFCQGFELSAIPLRDLEGDLVSARIIKVLAICLYGEDLRDRFPPHTLRDMFHYSRYLRFHLEERLPTFIEEDAGVETEVKATCGWAARLTLRSLYELVMLDEGRWTNDLWPCYEVFSRHYPERSSDAMELLVLALNPVSDEDRLRRALSVFVPWVYDELYRRAGMRSDARY